MITALDINKNKITAYHGLEKGIYYCPFCDSEVINKCNGLKKAPHFAHKDGNVNCIYSEYEKSHATGQGESELHKATKIKIKENFEKVYYVDKVELEERIGNRIADIVIYFNELDPKRRDKVIVEIQLSKIQEKTVEHRSEDYIKEGFKAENIFWIVGEKNSNLAEDLGCYSINQNGVISGDMSVSNYDFSYVVCDIFMDELNSYKMNKENIDYSKGEKCYIDIRKLDLENLVKHIDRYKLNVNGYKDNVNDFYNFMLQYENVIDGVFNEPDYYYGDEYTPQEIIEFHHKLFTNNNEDFVEFIKSQKLPKICNDDVRRVKIERVTPINNSLDLILKNITSNGKFNSYEDNKIESKIVKIFRKVDNDKFTKSWRFDGCLSIGKNLEYFEEVWEELMANEYIVTYIWDILHTIFYDWAFED